MKPKADRKIVKNGLQLCFDGNFFCDYFFLYFFFLEKHKMIFQNLIFQNLREKKSYYKLIGNPITKLERRVYCKN